MLAVLLAAAGVAIARLIDPHLRPGTPLDALGMALIVVAALALAVRRRWPIVAVAGVLHGSWSLDARGAMSLNVGWQGCARRWLPAGVHTVINPALLRWEPVLARWSGRRGSGRLGALWRAGCGFPRALLAAARCPAAG
jgi:hypothetical protein